MTRKKSHERINNELHQSATVVLGNLQRIERALAPGGKLFLLVPDKRLCFDYFRPLTTTGQWLDAFLMESKIHSVGAIFDFSANFVQKKNDDLPWNTSEEIIYERLSDSLSYIYENAKLLCKRNEYHDIHGGVYTLHSLRVILHDLRQLGLLNLSEVFIHDTVHFEFFMVLGFNDTLRSSEERLDLMRNVLKG